MNRRIPCSALRLAVLFSAGLLAGPAGLLPGPSVIGTAAAGEVGWIESFALAGDRDFPLAQLIPGTEDYYYYHALHYQNTEQWEKVEGLLKLWVDRYQWTERALEIQNRQALLTYGKDPQHALALLRSRLNLQFNHQKEELNQKPNLPTKLDPALVARAATSRPSTGFPARCKASRTRPWIGC